MLHRSERFAEILMDAGTSPLEGISIPFKMTVTSGRKVA